MFRRQVMEVEAAPALAPSEPGPAEARPLVRRVKLVWGVLFAVLAVLVISAALIYAGMQFFGYRFYEVTSTSMVPTFGKGDVVSSKFVPAHDIAIGDIILYKRDGYIEPIVHRVTRIQSDPDIHSVIRDKSGKILEESWDYSPRTFWAQGDANNAEDFDPISESHVIGVEKFVVPPPLNLIVTKVNRTLLLWFAGSAIGLFIALEVLDMGKIVAKRRVAAGSRSTASEGQD